MAKKTTEKASEKVIATVKATTSARKPGPEPGPFWRTQAGRWSAKVGGRQYTAPATIGRYNVAGANAWYEELVVRQDGGQVATPTRAKKRPAPIDNDDMPGSRTPHGLRRLQINLIPEVAAQLGDLANIIAAEKLQTSRNYSQTISVAIVEAMEKRQAKK